MDEKIPPANRVSREVGSHDLELKPADVTGQDRNVCMDDTGGPGSSEYCSDATLSSTTVTDLQQALPAAATANEKPFAPHSAETNTASNSDRTLKETPDAEPSHGDHDFPEGGLQAWLVVFGSFTGMTAGFGLMNTVGTFQAYLSTHQLAQYSPSLLGWIFSIYIFLAFFCGVQIGPIFDAKGPRWLVFAGSVALVGGTFAFAESTGAFGPVFIDCKEQGVGFH